MAAIDGTVMFEAGGRQRSLQFTTNRLCLLEDKLAKTPLDIAVELELNPRISTIRAMFWAGSGDADLTIAAAGDLIDDVGRTRAIELVREAYAAAFPAKIDDEGQEGDANPPVAAAG